jgi:hypothetical protein
VPPAAARESRTGAGARPRRRRRSARTMVPTAAP